MALEDQKKLTSIHNVLVVMLTICRGEKVCQLLKRGDTAGQYHEERLEKELLREEL